MTRIAARSRFEEVVIDLLGAEGVQASQSAVHVSNNLFSRYVAHGARKSFFFDRYPNFDPQCAMPAHLFRVTAEGIDSAIFVGDQAFVCHLKPIRPKSLFDEFSEVMSSGSPLAAAQIEDVAAFLRGLRAGICTDGDFRLSCNPTRDSWAVLERMASAGILTPPEAELIADCLMRASIFYDRARADAGEVILPAMALADMVRGDSGGVVGLPVLQMTSWPLLTGQILSNMVEIVWHFRRDPRMAIRTLKTAQAGLDLDLDCVIALVVDALLLHGHVNVHVHGGDPENLRDLRPLALAFADANRVDAHE